jgi:hypothetical protein
VAVGDGGEVFATWKEICPVREWHCGAAAARFDPDRGWGHPTKIGDRTHFDGEHDIVALADGSAVLALNDLTSNSGQISLWVFRPLRGWEFFGSLEEGFRPPVLRVIGGRRVATLWNHSREGRTNELRLALKTGAAWEPLGTIPLDPGAYTSTFDLAVSASGAAFAAWTLNAWPTSTVWVSRFADGWEPHQRLSSELEAPLAAAVSVAADERGNAAAVWQESPRVPWVDVWQASPLGESSIWASRYTGR